MEEDERTKMLDHLQQYVPHLEKLIAELKDPKRRNLELQLNQVDALHSMITDRKKQLKLDTLRKFEDVILRILHKVYPTIFKQLKSKPEPCSSVKMIKFVCKDPSEERNKISLGETDDFINLQKLKAARARLSAVAITPASPSPPRDTPLVNAPHAAHAPIVIPTEMIHKLALNPNEFHSKKWDVETQPNLSQPYIESYKTEKPDVFSRAAGNLTSSRSKKNDRLGTKVNMLKPPLSAEDLQHLTAPEKDSYFADIQQLSMEELEDRRELLLNKLQQIDDRKNLFDLRTKLTRKLKQSGDRKNLFDLRTKLTRKLKQSGDRKNLPDLRTKLTRENPNKPREKEHKAHSTIKPLLSPPRYKEHKAHSTIKPVHPPPRDKEQNVQLLIKPLPLPPSISSFKPESPQVEKIYKNLDSKFGNLLSSIDGKILVNTTASPKISKKKDKTSSKKKGKAKEEKHKKSEHKSEKDSKKDSMKKDHHTYLKTLILQNNVSNIPHAQFKNPLNATPNTFHDKINSANVFHPYDPIESCSEYDLNKMQPVDFYSPQFNQTKRPLLSLPNYANRPPHGPSFAPTDRQPYMGRPKFDHWPQGSKGQWHQERSYVREREEVCRQSVSPDPGIRAREIKERAAQRKIKEPPAPPTHMRRKSVDEDSGVGHTKYDAAYFNLDLGKSKEETFISALDSFHITGEAPQKFRIPTKKNDNDDRYYNQEKEVINEKSFKEIPQEITQKVKDEVTDIAQTQKKRVVPEKKKETKLEREKETEKITNAIQTEEETTTAEVDVKIKTIPKEEIEVVEKEKDILKETDTKEKVENEDEEEEEGEEENERNEKLLKSKKISLRKRKRRGGQKKTKKGKVLQCKQTPKTLRVNIKKTKNTKKKLRSGAKLEDNFIETVGERIKNRRRNIKTPEPTKAHKCKTVLDMLYEDIKEMFIRDGATETDTVSPRTFKNRLTSTADEEAASVLDSPKLRATSCNPKVVIEKTDLSKLVASKSKKDSDSENESLETTRLSARTRQMNRRKSCVYTEGTTSDSNGLSPIKRSVSKRNLKSKPNYTEDTDEELPRPMSEPEEEPPKQANPQTHFNQKETVAKKGEKKKKICQNLASGVIKKVYKKLHSNTTTPAPSVDGDRLSVADETMPQEDNESDTEFIEPDKNYYFDPHVKSECKLCSFKGEMIVQHYKTMHAKHEVLISRISPDNSNTAVEESIENGYEDIEVTDTWEANDRRKKFSYQCRFCQMFFKNENSESFFDHLTGHTGEYRFICNVCPFKTANCKCLRSHMHSLHNATVEHSGSIMPTCQAPPNFHIVFGYICAECNFIQMDKTSVETHVKIYHLGGNKKIYKINMSTIVSNPTEVPEENALAEVGEEVSKKPNESIVNRKYEMEKVEEPEPQVQVLQPEPAKKVVKEDPAVFKSNTDYAQENIELDKQRHEKMMEINKNIIPKRKFAFNMLDKIKSRLDDRHVEAVAKEIENNGSSLQLNSSVAAITSCSKKRIVQESSDSKKAKSDAKCSMESNVEKSIVSKSSVPIFNMIERMQGKVNVDLTMQPAAQSKEEDEMKKYMCPKCSHKSNHYKAMQNHIRAHVKPVQCYYCFYRVTYPYQLRGHQERKHPNLEFKCKSVEEAKEMNKYLTENILVLEEDGSYRKIRFKNAKRTMSDQPAQHSKVRIVDHFEYEEEPHAEKLTARKSARQIFQSRNSVVRENARKSTTQFKRTAFVDGYSYYGNKPDLNGIEELKTTLTFIESSLPVSVMQLKGMFDIFPTVPVVDIKYKTQL